VNEAYLRLVDQRQVEWRDRGHFIAIAAQAMRRILVDHARRQQAARRPGAREKLALEDAGDLATPSRALAPEDVLSLHAALEGLARRDPDQAKLVELRFFGGLSGQEIAEVLGVSTATVTREWRMARAWLTRAMGARRDGGTA
jgi:RNA polymerase sigma factor (TIGR02999 family)